MMNLNWTYFNENIILVSSGKISVHERGSVVTSTPISFPGSSFFEFCDTSNFSEGDLTGDERSVTLYSSPSFSIGVKTFSYENCRLGC
jgi:hypothetical protein